MPLPLRKLMKSEQLWQIWQQITEIAIAICDRHLPKQILLILSSQRPLLRFQRIPRHNPGHPTLRQRLLPRRHILRLGILIRKIISISLGCLENRVPFNLRQILRIHESFVLDQRILRQQRRIQIHFLKQIFVFSRI